MPSRVRPERRLGVEPERDYAPKHDPAVYYLPLRRGLPPARRAARDTCRGRVRARAELERARRVHLHHAQPLQRHARLPGRDGRRLARALAADDRFQPCLPRRLTGRSSSPGTRARAAAPTTAPSTRPTPAATSRCSSSLRRRRAERARRSCSITIRCSRRPSSCSASRPSSATRTTAPAAVCDRLPPLTRVCRGPALVGAQQHACMAVSAPGSYEKYTENAEPDGIVASVGPLIDGRPCSTVQEGASSACAEAGGRRSGC